MSALAASFSIAWPARYGGTKALARAAGVSVSAALAYRRGTREPGAAKLLAMMAASEQLEKDIIALVRAQRAAAGQTE